VSRQSRAKLEAALIDEVRGWQTDQDMFDDVAATYAGLNRTDMRCVDILQREGAMTAGQLGARARLSSGAVTAVVDKLERLDFVRRIRDTVDRRRVMIEASPDLLERGDPIFGPLAKQGQALVDRYTDAEIETVIRFLRENRALLASHTDRVHRLIAERVADAR
jgi:DNA-binding MarR family transcriptional regulator